MNKPDSAYYRWLSKSGISKTNHFQNTKKSPVHGVFDQKEV
ncbi:MAG: hypothetical protein ACXIUQ_01090 [Cecembia sp.]